MFARPKYRPLLTYCRGISKTNYSEEKWKTCEVTENRKYPPESTDIHLYWLLYLFFKMIYHQHYWCSPQTYSTGRDIVMNWAATTLLMNLMIFRLFDLRNSNNRDKYQPQLPRAPKVTPSDVSFCLTNWWNMTKKQHNLTSERFQPSFDWSMSETNQLSK